MTKEKNSFNVRYTNKDIVEKIEKQHDTLSKILEQAKITNGRVTALERKSLGVWISHNPFKFALFLLIFFMVIVSDSREVLINYLTKLI